MPKEAVLAHLDGIANKQSQGFVAVFKESLVGLVSYVICDSFSQYEPVSLLGQPHGNLAEGVVNRELVGQGIGSHLIELSKQALLDAGIQSIYVERHEENLASAGAMLKAGFVEVETFFDPERRQSGSRKITVCRFMLDSAASACNESPDPEK